MSSHALPPPRGIQTFLTTTTETTLYTVPSAPEKYTNILRSVRVANSTASSVTFTLKWRDNTGATDYSLIHGDNVPANGVIVLTEEDGLGFKMREGDLIKATAGTGNALYVILNISEQPRAS